MGFATPPRLIALAAAAIGTAVFWVSGLPLPLLLGPMAGCLVAALVGLPMQGMGVASTVMRTVLGVAIGASITRETLTALAEYLPTLMLIPLFVAAIGAAGYPFLRRVAGFDAPTAFYGAMPGGLQDMLIFGEEAGGDPRALSLIHATRILVIVAVAPFLIAWVYGIDLTAPPGAPASSVPPMQIGLMIAAGLAGWWAAAKVKLFGASILGPMILTAALSLAGIIHQRPPAEMIWAAQFFIGLAVGAKYTGITRRELRDFVGAGLVYSLIALAISGVFLWGASHLSPAHELDVLLSFLPGGQGEMVVVAIIAGADLGFVVTHHLLRIVIVIVLSPLVARRIVRRD